MQQLRVLFATATHLVQFRVIIYTGYSFEMVRFLANPVQTHNVRRYWWIDIQGRIWLKS